MVLSVEDVGIYKPSRRVYRHAPAEARPRRCACRSASSRPIRGMRKVRRSSDFKVGADRSPGLPDEHSRQACRHDHRSGTRRSPVSRPAASPSLRQPGLAQCRRGRVRHRPDRCSVSLTAEKAEIRASAAGPRRHARAPRHIAQAGAWHAAMRARYQNCVWLGSLAIEPRAPPRSGARRTARPQADSRYQFRMKWVETAWLGG